MKNIKLKDLEKLIIEKYFEDEKFKEFLNENKDLKVETVVENIKLKDLEDLEEFTEETVIDYLDEIANLEVMSEEAEKEYFKNFYDDNRDDEELIVKYLGEVASIAFNYTRDGIAYMDIVQEGTVGLMKAISNYNPENNGEFKNYCIFWIIKEMVMFIQNKVEDIKYEFKNYFKTKKENFGKEHNHKHEHEDEQEAGEVYLKEEDLLPSIEAIEKREKLVEKKINFFNLNNRLSLRHIDILNLYFGFGSDKRYSIYEIEEKLNLEKGQGETLFQEALIILSTVEGKISL
ncbi:MAG: sigma-70 family RNA polymerase sigma factor [Fusobacterium sp.]|nr:sigma-70 family RNA polymerase sigma factor [Fusobacterium sp.]